MSESSDRPSSEPAGPPGDRAMSFWDHLNELRRRLIYMLFAFLAGAVVAWIVREPILRWLTVPFVEAFTQGGVQGLPKLHFAAPHSLFVSYVKLSMIAGAVFALPIMLYQVWAFVAPGLYQRERRFALPFVVSSCLLFGTGGYFGWRLAFPAAFAYLLGFSGQLSGSALSIEPTVMVDDYVDFVAQMLIAFGAVFELPMVVFFLSIAGLVTHKHLIRFFRYFVVLAFVVGAVFTPPDPMSQFLVAVPLCLLYGVSIGIAFVFGKRPVTTPTSALEGTK